MKIITPEEEAAHNAAVWRGGSLGALGGLAVGSAAVYLATKRSHTFRQLTLPFRGFLVTAATISSGVITADSYSNAFQKSRDQFSDFQDVSQRQQSEQQSQKTFMERVKQGVSENRYPIVYGSWVASMGAAFLIVSRNKYLTGQQKLVQARVYAQGLTLAVLVASFALEGSDMRQGKGRWETVKVVDPNDPEHKKLIDKKIHHEAFKGEDQWMDMIEAQEAKLKARGHKIRDGDKSEDDNKKATESHGKNRKSNAEPVKKSNGQSEKRSSSEHDTSKDDSEDQDKGQSKGDSKESEHKDSKGDSSKAK